jgi:microcin C transport system substrate-binding protein
MRPANTALAAALVATFLVAPALAEDGISKSHGIALLGELKYGPDFQHFDYANPDAPKGGTIRHAAIGTFDTLNPFQLKGVKAAGEGGFRSIGGVFDTLMVDSFDEPDAEYGLIAESAEIPADRRWVQFNLRKEARFHDGSPITPEDVIWTFDTLKTKGEPHMRLYYADVLKAEQVGERSVKFSFRSNDNPELPLIVGELPVLSKKYWENRDFEKTTLEPPLGSGPYKIESFEPGRSITYRRVADYWAKDLPVSRGRYNYDVVRFDYYRDDNIALEAFKAGQYDLRAESSAKNWAIGYDCPALRDGFIKKEELPSQRPAGMQGFAFNTRRPIFQDRRVRLALDYLFDFEWTNKNLFYGAYQRTKSYYENSPLASSGVPGADELKLLEKYKGEIPDEVFTTAYEPPKTDGSGNIRDNMRQALRLLKEAGWSVKGDALVNDETGKPFTFEFLLDEPAFERIVLPFSQNLARVGIKANLRLVDPAQYQNRLQSFDFDMAVASIGESLSPGNEQRDFFGSAAAGQNGSDNYMGIRSKAVDDLIELIIHAPDRQSLVTRVHALDRVLLSGHYVISNFYNSVFRVAVWDKFERPKISPPYMLDIDSWWIDPKRAAAVEAREAQEPKK